MLADRSPTHSLLTAFFLVVGRCEPAPLLKPRGHVQNRVAEEEEEISSHDRPTFPRERRASRLVPRLTHARVTLICTSDERPSGLRSGHDAEWEQVDNEGRA